jgi:RNA polymerase sigma-70 factor (ECF subfamily)
LYGAENVGRFLISVTSKVYAYMPDFSQEIVIANNLPSIISHTGGEPLSLSMFDTEDGRIKNIYIQTNPDKLKQFKNLRR